MARPKPEAPAVPEFTSDRMRLIAPILTPEIITMAHERLSGGSLMLSGDALTDERKAKVKLAFILVYEMNPLEHFQAYEEAVLRGMGKDSVNPAKKEGSIRPL